MKLNFDKTKVKLFLTFLIVYTSFIHWAGWNEESRLTLTRAIVEETRLEIDTFANTTGDRAYLTLYLRINETYIYI